MVFARGGDRKDAHHTKRAPTSAVLGAVSITTTNRVGNQRIRSRKQPGRPLSKPSSKKKQSPMRTPATLQRSHPAMPP
ncbi:hypothetical protein [Rubidibacter lacunae]|uniref:hypothetical protein n=1 Tax=Rubidibacter lacunae TaxID=582514 RepID=UPI0012EBBB28|nr:hypothetical protein [Rubidibacter lacunae]